MKYSHEEIQKMLEPLFEYMKTEHPNNCKLVIDANAAELIYEHQEQIWLSEVFHNKVNLVSKEMAESPEIQKMKDVFFANSLDNNSQPKDCTITTTLFNGKE